MQNETEAPPKSEERPQGGSPTVTPESSITGRTEREIHNPQDNLIPMGTGSGFNFGVFLAYLVMILALLATAYFWWIGRNTVDVVAEKELKLQSIEQQIKAPAMAATEKEANEFKTSVSVLSQAKKDRYSMSEFLQTLYTKITNDVKITSLSVSSDGNISIAGSTKSYRTTADLVMALKSWSALTDVDLGSAAVEMGTESGTKPRNIFSISAKLNKKPATTVSTTSGSTTETTPSAGANLEESTATGVTPAQPTTGGTQ